MEEFELFLHLSSPLKRVSGLLQTHPFAWGCCLLEGAAGEQGLVGRSVCRLCLVCVRGSLRAITSPNQRTFILNSYFQLNVQPSNSCIYVNTNRDFRTKVSCLESYRGLSVVLVDCLGGKGVCRQHRKPLSFSLLYLSGESSGSLWMGTQEDTHFLHQLQLQSSVLDLERKTQQDHQKGFPVHNLLKDRLLPSIQYIFLKPD